MLIKKTGQKRRQIVQSALQKSTRWMTEVEKKKAVKAQRMGQLTKKNY